ncbi:hypothetical protein LTR37_006089 [Vermiconidia calcicola]|uniref:Uncharacterized protein n=1 Tax=Vermiconidia calcicola TaxID=1690605 RepID=A0ACC3NI43_9PEZI|nr:hypothetical protein LTR37_006089 [Vermiconidia calcicola]
MEHDSEPFEQHELPILYEKHLPAQIETHLAAYCDAHDLIAAARTNERDVVVWRLNGQEAFTVKHPSSDDYDGESGSTPIAVKWKPDGSLLGVGWADGGCCLYSGEDGKLVSQHSTSERTDEGLEWRLDLSSPDHETHSGTAPEEGEAQGCTCVGWTTFPAAQSGSMANGKPSPDINGMGELTTEDWFNGADDDVELMNGHAVKKVNANSISQLADSIMTLDVTKPLPSLSAIPSHGLRAGSQGSKFSSQAAVDGIFETRKPASHGIDVLITSGSSGFSNVLVNDSVKIGSVRLEAHSAHSASNSRCSSSAILSDAETDGMYHLHYIDLPLAILGGSLLHVIATNMKRLQNSMTYITQTIRCVQHDFTTGLQFPSRLLDRLKEELDPDEDGDTISNLYHLAMTTSFTPKVLEWLTDIVKDTNHKRWDQAVNTMYSNIQNHIFINLLPALDRLSIATSTLRGHAKLHEGTSKFDVPSELFSTLLNQVDALRLVAQKVQLIVMTEFRQFRAFGKWLRVMIEVGIAGPGSKSAIETEEREVPSLDYSSLLSYINDTMTWSKLAIHVEQAQAMHGSCDKGSFFDHPGVRERSREKTNETLEKLHTLDDLDGQGGYDISMPTLTARIAAQVRLCLESITEWQSKMLSQPTTTPLGEIPSDSHVFDMRMVCPTQDRTESVTKILMGGDDTTTLHLHRIARFHDNTFAFEKENIDLQGEVLHAAFFGVSACIVLIARADERRCYLLSCDLQAPEDRLRVLHAFPTEGGFETKRFVVGGRKGKMVCVVFGAEARAWQVLDLERGGSGGRLGDDQEMHF